MPSNKAPKEPKDTTTWTEDEPPPMMPPPKAAKFAGVCGGCKDRIAHLQPIVWVRGIGTRCVDCCIKIWGPKVRAQFGLPAPTPIFEHAQPDAYPDPVDPVDRPIQPDENGRIDMRVRKPTPSSESTRAPRQRRTYEEIFGPDN